MRDIKITILSDGTARIEEPFCFCGEHNAARLCITLNDELKTDASYYLLSFDVYGLSRRIVSNIIDQRRKQHSRLYNRRHYILPSARGADFNGRADRSGRGA